MQLIAGRNLFVRKITFMLVSAICISAFAADMLEGTYLGRALKITFKPNGKVSTMVMGMPMETNYTIDGDKVKFHFPGGDPVVLKKMPDGSLDGGIQGKYVRK